MARIISLLTLTLLLVLTIPHASAMTGTLHIEYPENETWTNLSEGGYDFNFTFIDPDSLSAGCTLWLNDVVRAIPSLDNDTSEIVTIGEPYFNEGPNVWNFSCDDGNEPIYTGNMTLYVDMDSPVMYVSVPEINGEEVDYEDYTFINLFTILSVNDTVSPYTECELFFNDSSERKRVVNVADDMSGFVGMFMLASGLWFEFAPITNGTSNLLFTPAYDGIYKWWINCTDLAGNTIGSSIMTANMHPPEMLDIISPENTTYESPDDIAIEYNIPFEAGNLGSTYYLLDGEVDDDMNIDTEDPQYSVQNGRYEVLGTFDVGGSGSHNITIIALDHTFGMQNVTIYFTVVASFNDSIEITNPGNVITSTSTTVNVVLIDDADECNISMDDSENVTMQETSGTEWTYYAPWLSEGEHTIAVWCYPEAGNPLYAEKTFHAYAGDYGISVAYPENKTYWATDSINLSLTTTRDSEYCTATLDDGSALLMKDITEKRWYQLFSGVSNGLHLIDISCSDKSGNVMDETIQFTSYDYECADNQTGICNGTQWCSVNECIVLTCTGCSYASDHKCIPHECCGNDECLKDQACVDNECEDIGCDCGVIEDHECIEYECCSNFDCGGNEECDTETNTCIVKGLKILAPDTVTSGQSFTITIMDHNMNPVSGVKVKVEYPSGKLDSLTTNSQGSSTFVAAETGSVMISADMAGYEKVTSYIDVEAGLNMSLILIIILVILLGGGGFFYWTHLPPLKLSKEVNDQNVILKVKNRTGEYMENVLVSDSVPTGAYMSCGLTPKMEVFGPETHLTWFAALNPGEEIVISYQASSTSEGFIIRVGDDEYNSDVGFMGVFSDLLSKLKKSPPANEQYQ